MFLSTQRYCRAAVVSTPLLGFSVTVHFQSIKSPFGLNKNGYNFCRAILVSRDDIHVRLNAPQMFMNDNCATSFM